MRDIILKHALLNAIEFGGKANASAVIGKVVAEKPELKADMAAVSKAVAEVVKEVNSWNIEKQKAELKKFGKIEKPKKAERTGLPPLPEAKKGKVVMRLAPFPSGPLHIGNAKPYILNDEYARAYKGKLLLIIDDTMGSPQKQIVPEAYNLIPEGLKWLGVRFDPKIIFKSDRLNIYYKYAVLLIEKGFAYVCECSYDQLKHNRANGIPCNHRDYSIKENMSKWQDMLEGKYAEGQAVLRLKTDMGHPNPAFRDRVLFRITTRTHPRVKNKYRVWPLLEFSWAIDDHLLGITHILRGKDLMMESEMERFIWNVFGWPHPQIVHTGLVRIEGVKVSKSKSQLEIAKGIFKGWDDPRTWSLQSLRKRGFLPDAIRAFVLAGGVTEHDVTIPIDNLYAENRKMIDAIANRYFFVAEPVEITLDRLVTRSVKAPLYPGKRKYRTIPASRKIFIDKLDYMANKGREVRLMHFCNIVLDKNAKVTGKP
ncbi:MAG: glutamate--tRNA ligase, partial [Candidatus Aenigmatarchaeota archaeon]